MAADTLHLGNITVKNQGFGLVLSSSSDFVDISCDGLFVSLCASHLSPQSAPSISLGNCHPL